MKYSPLIYLFAFPCLFASTITFSGTDGSLDFDTVTGSHTLSGLEITLSANDGVINATSSGGLGINDSVSGDDTDGIDSTNTIEILTISFDQDVIFNSLDLANFGASDSLDLTFGGGATIHLTNTSPRTFDTFLSSSETLTIAAGAGSNGVNITNLHVTLANAVPEPSTAVLALSGIAILFAHRKR